MSDHTTTGDGLLSGLQVLAAMVQTGKPASEMLHQFDPVPQLLKNVRYGDGQDPLAVESVKSAIAEAEAALEGTGRLLIRKSGTEPLIRVMAECIDAGLLTQTVDGVVASVEEAVGT